jgi:hypothetical protein
MRELSFFHLINSYFYTGKKKIVPHRALQAIVKDLVLTTGEIPQQINDRNSHFQRNIFVIVKLLYGTQ